MHVGVGPGVARGLGGDRDAAGQVDERLRDLAVGVEHGDGYVGEVAVDVGDLGRRAVGGR